MPFTPEAVRRRRAEIARECRDGTITEMQAGLRMVEADPDFGGGYILLGNAQSGAGDLRDAETSYWKALDRMPCDYTPYLALSDIRRKQGADDPLSQRLMTLGIWKLAFSDSIPEQIAQFFSERMGNVDFDFGDPATFKALAKTMQPPAPSPEVRDRLLPYELLNDLQLQSSDGLDPGLLRDILTRSGVSVPLWRAALRQWAERESALSSDALALVIALLGELAGPEILGDLLDLADFGERRVFLHANWAIWRLGRRFPIEAIARIRDAAAAARLTLRCALAEQIYLLSEAPPVELLMQLLEGFPAFAHEDDAPYLLAIVMQILRDSEHVDEAEHVFGLLQAHLSDEARRWVRDVSDEGLIPRLVDEQIEDLAIEEICCDRLLMDDEEQDGDQETQPAVALPKPGRNDPCWCGSGKKYKKCHLAADEAEDRPGRAGGTDANPPLPLHTKLQRELIESLVARRDTADYAEAYQLYFGLSEDLDSDADNDRLGGFLEWYVHDFRPAGTGRTLVEEYLRKRAGRLPAAERELLESWRESRFGFWEVQRVDKGKGLELKDLFEGDRFFVHDVSSSRSLVRWDCLLSRVHKSDDKWYFVGNGLCVPRNLKPRLIEQIEQESRNAVAAPAAFLRAHSYRWHRVLDELAAEQFAALRIVNAEGDELEFCAAEYRVEDEAGLIPALAAFKPFEPEENQEAGVRSFAWLEQVAEEPRRSYGRIEIRGRILRLECNSRKRLAIGRQLVEKHGGVRLVHLADSFESLHEARRKALERQDRPQPRQTSQVPPEIERELVLKWKREHYARWVDSPLPALGGRTPREAARSETGRRALEDLLRAMENDEEHSRREGRAAFDFASVRETLGM